MSPGSQPRPQLILELAVPSPLRTSFDYLPPAELAPSHYKNLQAGMRVRVPFGKRELIAILIGTKTASDIDPAKLKPAIAILDSESLFSNAMMSTLKWAASYYQHPVGEVMAASMPTQLRKGKSPDLSKTVWQLAHMPHRAELDSLNLTAKQSTLLQWIQTQGQVSRDDCEQQGFSMAMVSKLVVKQLVVKCEVSIKTSSFSASSASRLLPAKPTATPPALNSEQTTAVKAINDKAGGFQAFLLNGVTGSGKTEVYMQIMDQVIAKNKQCLILVPEIGLTPQTISRFENRFNCPVVTLHSGLTDAARMTAWRQARSGYAGIIIGTRSAVFTPLARPGLIVVDEEHDSSFKQQDGFKYSARDLAIVRAQKENIGIIMGSATPSLESLHNARNGKYTELKLLQRAGFAQTPSIELIDTSHDQLIDGFSPGLLRRIDQHLKRDNQVLIFLNRRGFAPALSCNNCGWVAECPRCDVRYTMHKVPPSLRCHHCGTQRQLPKDCQHCHSKSLATPGVGTQKCEARLTQEFASYPILRIDRDTTHNNSQLQTLLDEVNTEKPCILLGTQMLAKGHHFPRVTLVAVLEADAGLFSADFRGQEFMVQTLFQVAGRAGRADQAGEVLVQTNHSTHHSLQSLLAYNYDDFANLLLAERLESAMPPFSHLVMFRAESHHFSEADFFLGQTRGIIEKIRQENFASTNDLRIHGPLPAPMEKRAGRYRVQLLLQSLSRRQIQGLLSQALPLIQNLPHSRKVRWSIDVGPQDMI